MLWPPNVTEELRNDVRFALRFKIGRKQQPLTGHRARHGRRSDRRTHPAVQIGKSNAAALGRVCGVGAGWREVRAVQSGYWTSGTAIRPEIRRAVCPQMIVDGLTLVLHVSLPRQMTSLLAATDKEEALSIAYVHAVAAGAGYVVSKKDFDRDGIDVTFEAGGAFRPKVDAQLKATVNLQLNEQGIFRYPCRLRNYDLLRIETQTPRILIVLHLPNAPEEWLAISLGHLVLRNCAYWACLTGLPEVDNQTSVTIDILPVRVFHVEGLRALMEMSRAGRIG
jgi:hypothetical protein